MTGVEALLVGKNVAAARRLLAEVGDWAELAREVPPELSRAMGGGGARMGGSVPESTARQMMEERLMQVDQVVDIIRKVIGV